MNVAESHFFSLLRGARGCTKDILIVRKALTFQMVIYSQQVGLVASLKKLDRRSSKPALFILRLVVYSNSSFLTMTFLSMYGLVHGVACVPKSRISAVKSLLHYGVQVFEHGLVSPTQAAKS